MCCVPPKSSKVEKVRAEKGEEKRTPAKVQQTNPVRGRRLRVGRIDGDDARRRVGGGEGGDEACM